MPIIPTAIRTVKTPVIPPPDDDLDLADLPWEADRCLIRPELLYTEAMLRSGRGNQVIPIELARYIAARRI